MTEQGSCNTLVVGGVIIERLQQVKYPGTYFDDQLNWKAHINYLCRKLTKILCAFFKLIKKLKFPNNIDVKLYHVYHYSQICYGIEPLDGTAGKINLNKIQRLQNKNHSSPV